MLLKILPFVAIFCVASSFAGGFEVVARESRALPERTTDWSKCTQSCDGGIMKRTYHGREQVVNCSIARCHRDICCEIDLVFVLDRSGSMNVVWGLAKQFMKEVVNQITFGPTPFGVRVGIVSYYGSSQATVHLQLIQGITRAAVITAINWLPAPTGWTIMAPALRRVPGMFTSANGDRCRVCNVAIVVTDSAVFQGAIANPLAKLKVPPLYNMKFFAVGVGNFEVPNTSLLDQVASDPDSYYSHRVTPWTVSQRARTVAKNACQACDHCPPVPHRRG